MNTLRQIWVALTALFLQIRNALGGKRTSWGENRDEDDR